MINGRPTIRLIPIITIAIVHASDDGHVSVLLQRVPQNQPRPEDPPHRSAAFRMDHPCGPLWTEPEHSPLVSVVDYAQWYLPLWAICFVEPDRTRLVLTDQEPIPTPQDISGLATIHKAARDGSMMYEYIRTINGSPPRTRGTGEW